MVINKPRQRGRNSRGRSRRSSRRRDHHQRTAAEQLDYEMELLQAQRDGREEQFKEEERKKNRTRTAARLDAEMDDYFNSRPKDGEENKIDIENEPVKNDKQNEPNGNGASEPAKASSEPVTPATEKLAPSTENGNDSAPTAQTAAEVKN